MYSTLRSVNLGSAGGVSVVAVADKIACVAAAGILCAMAISAVISQAIEPGEGSSAEDKEATSSRQHAAPSGTETLIAGYLAQPLYDRSDVHLTRVDDTDLTLKGVGWDGDALRFPIDGGVRAVRGSGAFGFMVDFLHNKAVSRLGKGAHGRKLANPIIEDADTVGTLKGKPAPERVKLTDVFERLEFTHGHNVLLFTPIVRLANIAPRIRPYIGIGAGFALPHVEVWFPGEASKLRTSEYQYAGPAVQVLAGLEFRTGKMSYFVEYKFTYAWISAALTGDRSWRNFDIPGDLLRQVGRWWSGEESKIGRISTTLAAHQAVVGAGYWVRQAPAAP